jgi:phytoene/squalene synthetase
VTAAPVTRHRLAIPPAHAAAYAHCEAVARAHYENFPVASRLLPAAMRPHVAAVYAFARAADDFADEGTLAPAERYRLLDDWKARLHAPPPAPASADATDRVFAAVAQTRQQCGLDIGLFDDLLSAFRQDVETRRYAEWSAVLDYCRRSAHPVGRLVLGIAGYRGREVEQASDALCTALQLANFWQDFGVPVADLVGGRLRLELRLTWLGGMRILERAAAPARNPLTSRPTLGAPDLPGLLWRAIRWRGR